MVENDNNENIESVLIELKSLRIQQTRILSRIDRLIGVLESTNTPTPTAVKSEYTEEVSSGKDAPPKRKEGKRTLKKDDRVRVKNPKQGESETGTIIGFTTTGQVRLHLDSGQNTRRIRRNVTFEES